MKVYIVTSGIYSDYHIDGVFLSQEQAEIYCGAKYDTDFSGDPFYIEEWDTDENDIEVIPGTKVNYHVIISKGFSAEWDRVRAYITLKPLRPFEFINTSTYLDGWYDAVLGTDDEDKILKIFRDWLAQKKAEEAGL